MNQTIRTFGYGGLGGYVGYYSSPGIGKFYMTTVNKNELAKITTKEGKLMSLIILIKGNHCSAF